MLFIPKGYLPFYPNNKKIYLLQIRFYLFLSRYILCYTRRIKFVRDEMIK